MQVCGAGCLALEADAFGEVPRASGGLSRRRESHHGRVRMYTEQWLIRCRIQALRSATRVTGHSPENKRVSHLFSGTTDSAPLLTAALTGNCLPPGVAYS